MPKLLRPHIPLSVRALVAMRQFLSVDSDAACKIRDSGLSDGKQLELMLRLLFGRDAKVELHHRPALLNRKKLYRGGEHVSYSPPANDPEYLVYLPEDDHDIETRVRGVGAQHSDLGLRRKNKNIDRRLSGEEPRGRRLQSANRWPPKGSRKIRSKRHGT